MTTTQAAEAEASGFPLDAPDIKVSVRQTFGIDSDMEVPAFSQADAHVPALDKAYQFDRDTTLAILAGYAYNRRVMIQGYHGTGKSTHIEQVAARLNWPCIRVNLDMEVPEADSPAQDRLSDVVCYEEIVDGIRAIVDAGHINLVETLSEKIAARILTDQRIERVRVRVEKLDIFADATSVGVEIERSQH